MNTTLRLSVFRIPVLLGFILTPLLMHAGDDFAWAPITEADWAVTPDSANGGMHAVMMFEKVVSDDREFEKGEYYLEVYRRIKVFTPEGRAWAEVTLPYVRKIQEVEELTARTVLPGGAEIMVNEDQIHESEPLKTEDVRVLQKSFSFPGVTDGSILEYRYILRSSNFHNDWIAQKNILLMRGEYTWKFISSVTNSLLLSIIRELELQPNYIWLNCGTAWNAELRPSKEAPEEVYFTVRDLPGFRAEPYALADESVKAQLICYYGRSGGSQDYWKKISGDSEDAIETFNDDRDVLKEIVRRLGSPTSLTQQIEAAYRWVTRNIRNVNTIEDDEDVESNETLEDMVEHGYGTTREINILFYALMQEMGADSRMVYMMDHRNGRFIKDAKFWQFDCSAVHVTGEGGVHLFFAPGYRFMPPGLVPWYTEGTQGLFVGHPVAPFIVLPPSSAETNRIERSFMLRLDQDLGIRGIIREEHSGHAARSLWLSLSETEGEGSKELLRKDLKDLFPRGEVDSASIVTADTMRALCVVSGSVTVPPIQKLSTTKALLHPFVILETQKSPFTAERRSYPIVMEYAFLQRDRMTFVVPANWAVESLPKPTTFQNKIGKVTGTVEVVGDTMTFERTMTLNQAFWPESHYKDVKALFQSFERLEDFAAVLAAK